MSATRSILVYCARQSETGLETAYLWVSPERTAIEALQQLRWLPLGQVPQPGSIGVLGRSVEPGYRLQHLDRLELYQPLVASAKQSRLNRLKRCKP